MREAEEKYKERLEAFAKAREMTEEEAEKTALAKIVKRTFLDEETETEVEKDGKEKKKRLEASHKKQAQGAAARPRV